MMDRWWYEDLVDPATKEKLEVVDGQLLSQDGKIYKIVEGIPVLLKIADDEKSSYALDLFQKKAQIYDLHQHLSFDTFYQEEESVRNNLIDKLQLGDKMKVLELSAGTGRDSILINRRLQKDAKLYVQDISMDMLQVLKGKFAEGEVYITQSDACALPYADNCFDAIYSFAGVGMSTYADARVIMNEIVRVAKEGARVVIGGLSMAPWLYKTEFAKILINHNDHYENKLDLSCLPVEARDVSVSWILNGAGFCVEFTVGTGEPMADFDFDIPGERGGSLRTRYYGKLEGVSPEAKAKAYELREKMGISMYDLLNKMILQEYENIMSQEDE